jgi:hypothetical protein
MLMTIMALCMSSTSLCFNLLRAWSCEVRAVDLATGDEGVLMGSFEGKLSFGDNFWNLAH